MTVSGCSFSSPQNEPAPQPPERLLRGVQGATGLDFTGYRPSNVSRRVQARMRQVGLADFGAYTDFCERAPEEYAALAQTILIPATTFFRDPSVWEAVSNEVIPRLRANARKPLHVWCAGCASGEEAYTLAMVLAEAAGSDTPAGRIRLLATDVSAREIERARRGVYPDDRVDGVPPRLRDAYFARTPAGWAVDAALREAVRFERHDLTHDAAPGRFDLISCRNTLMYFAPALQEQALARLARALRPGGCLLLGRSEGIPPGAATAWTPLDRAQRLYARRPHTDRALSRLV